MKHQHPRLDSELLELAALILCMRYQPVFFPPSKFVITCFFKKKTHLSTESFLSTCRRWLFSIIGKKKQTTFWESEERHRRSWKWKMPRAQRNRMAVGWSRLEGASTPSPSGPPPALAGSDGGHTASWGHPSLCLQGKPSPHTQAEPPLSACICVHSPCTPAHSLALSSLLCEHKYQGRMMHLQWVYTPAHTCLSVKT